MNIVAAARLQLVYINSVRVAKSPDTDDTTLWTLVSECHLHLPPRNTTAGHTLHCNRLIQTGVSDPPGRLYC